MRREQSKTLRAEAIALQRRTVELLEQCLSELRMSRGILRAWELDGMPPAVYDSLCAQVPYPSRLGKSEEEVNRIIAEQEAIAARKALDDADAALAAYGSKAYLAEIEVSGRRQKFQTPGEFMAWRSRLQAEVAREVNAERLANGLASKNKLLVRFRGL